MTKYSRLRRAAQKVFNQSGLARSALSVYRHAKTRGKPQSERLRRPVDAEGNPIPWWTYFAIDFMDHWLEPSDIVLEYGAGHSTLWFAGRVERVIAVEHERGWLEYLLTEWPENAIIRLKQSKGEYVHAADGLGPFDVIAIDGQYRHETREKAPSLLADGGVIVIDDVSVYDETERESYREAGLRRLTCRGLRSLSVHRDPTAIWFDEWIR